MSYGTGPFGQFAAGLGYSPSPAERGTIASSRLINGSGQLVQTGDDAGSFAGMNDIQQRILILCALAGREPVKQGPDFETTVRAKLRTALLPLTSGAAPSIKLLSVAVESMPNGTTKIIRYIDLTRGTRDEIKV